MKRIIILFSIGLVFTLLGCSEDFLEQPPRGSLTVGSFPATAQDASLAVNASYNSLREWQINTGGFPLLDMMSDEATKGSNPGDGSAIAVYDQFAHTATEGSIERWYKTLYQSVKRTNLVINEVPAIEMDPVLRDRYVAEARFLRAYFYSILVRAFGDVPLVTVTDPSLELGRTAVSEILETLIYPDLEFAINTLPPKSGYDPEDLGRATSGAAMALMARIKLFYGDFEAVEQLTGDIIASNEYELAPTHGDAFTAAGEHGAESVFEVSAKPLDFTNGGNQYANTQAVRGTPNRGWGFCRPDYVNLVSLYEANLDPRRESTIIFLNEEIDGIIIKGDASTPDTTTSGGQIVEIECYNQKVWYPGTDATSSFGHNRRIIRYADVLLMHAEALNENGKSQQALSFLNAVRQRAREGNSAILPDITDTEKSVLKEKILQERKFELALEGLRFWDLVRTGKAEGVLGPMGFITGKNEVFPLPQSEVDISQGRITQNEGY